MRRFPATFALRAAICATVFAPAASHASGRQLHGGPLLGGAILADAEQSAGASIGAQLAWGATDAIRVHASLEAPLTARLSTGRWRVAPGLSAGVAYALDALSVVPWIGVEVRGHAIFDEGAANARWIVGGGPRLGVDWLARRYVGLTVQGAWSACLLDGAFGQLATVTVGARWTIDL
jgi:hypothetical protein